MTNRLLPRVTSLALAALVTWSMLFGIDALTLHEHAASDLLARSAMLITAA